MQGSRDMIVRFAFIMTLIIVLLTPSVNAEIDDYHSAILREYVLPLKWENVKDHPYWMGGEHYCYDSESGRSGFTLKPGQFIIVRLPREEKIHIVSMTKELNNNDLSIYASNGSGLYVKRHLSTSDNGRTLVYHSEAKEVN